MTPQEHLIAARAKIAQGWCQRAIARNAAGLPVNSNDPAAVSWCFIGALGAVVDSDSKKFYATFNIVDPLQPQVSVWNDDPARTQADVLALFDRLIAQV